MNYGDLVRDALRIAWRNKFLWLFGFFIGGGLSATFSFINPPRGSGGTVGVQPGSVPGSVPGSAPAWFSEVGRWAGENLVLFAVLASVLALALVVVSVAISAFCNGALADSVAALHRGEGRRLSTALRAGASNLWRVFLYLIVFFLVSLGVYVVLAAPAFLLVVLPIVLTFSATDSTTVRTLVAVLVALLAVALLVVAVAVLVSLYVVYQLALRALVVGRRGVLGSIGAGYSVYRGNLGRSLLTWLVIFVIGIVLGIVLLICVFLLSLLQTALVSSLADQTAAAITAAVVTGLLFTIPFVLLYALLGTFFHSYWTLAYLRLTEPPPVPTAAPVAPEPGPRPSYG